jgi:hypothetical protein
MTLTTDERFFYDHAGLSYRPDSETPEQGRERGAREMAAAERTAREAGVSYDWSRDRDADSSDFSDETPPWRLWQCVAYDVNGTPCASLHAIDFGRDGTPHSSTYRRVVEAELADEALGRLCRHCGATLDKESAGWVDARSGDDGGTYDICPDNGGTNGAGGHEPREELVPGDDEPRAAHAA